MRCGLGDDDGAAGHFGGAAPHHGVPSKIPLIQLQSQANDDTAPLASLVPSHLDRFDRSLVRTFQAQLGKSTSMSAPVLRDHHS